MNAVADNLTILPQDADPPVSNSRGVQKARKGAH